MTIDFRKPRYVIPLIVLPFLCIFFYIYKGSFGKERAPQAGRESLQTDLAGVSEQVRSRTLSDKLEAYRDQYRQGDGYTAIGHIGEEQVETEVPNTLYNEQERRLLDSIDRAMKARYGSPLTGDPPSAAVPLLPAVSGDPHEKALQEALAAVGQPSSQEPGTPDRADQPDPMELFRQQMEMVDSMAKANDPEYRAEQERIRQAELHAQQEREAMAIKLDVTKVSGPAAVFNTVKPENEETPITA